MVGLLPPYVSNVLEEQAAQTYAHMHQKGSDLEKRLFLMEIFKNRTLFYYLFSQHLEEFNPIVYDPTIADTIENYSELLCGSSICGLLRYQSPRKYRRSNLENAETGIRLIVVTDAEGIWELVTGVQTV